MPLVVTFQQGDRPPERRVLYALSETDRMNWLAEVERLQAQYAAAASTSTSITELNKDTEKAPTMSSAQRLGNVFRRPGRVNLLPTSNSAPKNSMRESLMQARKTVDEINRELAKEQKVR